MKKTLFVLSLIFAPALALADTTTPVDNGPADAAVHAAIEGGNVLSCDGNNGSCHDHEYHYNLYYNPSKTIAIAWVFGYPLTGGAAHEGELAEFRDLNGWKLVQVYKTQHSVDGDWPANKEVVFLPSSSVRVTYHYLTDDDPRCCATGRTTEVFPLQ